MIGIEQWRASIGLYHSGSCRRLAGAKVFIFMVLSCPDPPAHRQALRRLVYQLPQTLLALTLFMGGLACVAGLATVKNRLQRSSGTQLLVLGCALAMAVAEGDCGSLERSVRALAILLIMSGDVEQNPGPLGMRDLAAVSRYLSNLNKSKLSTLGLALGLYITTLDNYATPGTTSEFRENLIRDWTLRRDNCGEATWSSLARALRDEGVSQTGIADKIEAEQIKDHQEGAEGEMVSPVKLETYQESISAFKKRTPNEVNKLLPLLPSIMPDPLHTLPESHTKLNLTDPVEAIHCDSAGGVYNNLRHGITLLIPKGAIPDGEYLEISIGVGLCGNFSFPSSHSPVSAIVWLCSKSATTFLKPVEVHIPHFLDCKSKEDAESLDVQFLKASHWNSTSETAHFIPADGEADLTNKGVLHTQHFCHLCIAAGVSSEQLRRSNFCIAYARPQSITSGSCLYFYAAHFLKTCIQCVENQLADGYFLDQLMVFKFADVSHGEPAITGEYRCSAAKPVMTLQPTRISEDEVDFRKLHENGELELREKMKMYPPNMQLRFGNLSSCEQQVVTVQFRGTQKPVEKEIIIPDSYDSASVHKIGRKRRNGPAENTTFQGKKQREIAEENGTQHSVAGTSDCREQLLLLKDPTTGPTKSTSTPTPSSIHDSDSDYVLDNKPTLMALMKFKIKMGKEINIIERVGSDYFDFGMLLLDDENGIKVASFEKQQKQDANRINRDIFMEWIQGKGVHPVTWRKLIEVLEDANLHTLASEIKDACV